MFDWFWRFLYSISEILFEIIDGMMSIANMLCGIQPIKVDGKQTDFLSYLIGNQKILYGFVGAAFVGLFLIMIFSVFAMMKAIKSETQLTPAQVCVKVIKTLGIFLIVPAVMILFTKLVNELMIVLYQATSYGSTSMGDFLFEAFLPDGMSMEGSFVNWSSSYAVDAFMEQKGFDLSDYKFFFSWICCIPLLFALAKGLLNFVDRTISIILLFIISPLSISSSIIDDGSHFKLWRDQVLVKYLIGYGIIIGLNVYILIVSIICGSGIVFFDNAFLNFLFKIAFMLGGAVGLERTMALAGNLVSAGAGSQELRESAGAYNSMKGIAGGVASFAGGVLKLPFKTANFVNDIRAHGVKQKAAGIFGLKTNKDYRKEGWKPKGEKSTEEKILEAITGGGGKGGNNNTNNSQETPENKEDKGNANNNNVTPGGNFANNIKNALTSGAGSINDTDDDDDF